MTTQAGNTENQLENGYWDKTKGEDKEKNIYLATRNVWATYEQVATFNLIRITEKYKIDIMTLQETEQQESNTT